ncbi:MAG: hypothetical protein JJW00_03610 [Sulfurimonas sp.]|nr:hypothetical protein [Sulfurimonas sp.]
MTALHLLVEDDFIDSFVSSLPEEVVIVEEDFKANQALLKETINDYENSKDSFVPYHKSMIVLDEWLKKTS